MLLTILSTGAVKGAVEISPAKPGEEAEILDRRTLDQAEISLSDKLRVARARYDQRQAFRQNLVDSIRTTSESRRIEISAVRVSPDHFAEKADTPPNYGMQAAICLLVVSVGAGLHRMRRRKRMPLG